MRDEAKEKEINEAVALKLGWKRTAQPHLWKRPGEEYDRLLWGFCTQIDPAWEIVKFHEGFVLHNYPFHEPKYLARLIREHDQSEAEAESMPMAICLAFLKLK